MNRGIDQHTRKRFNDFCQEHETADHKRVQSRGQYLFPDGAFFADDLMGMYGMPIKEVDILKNQFRYWKTLGGNLRKEYSEIYYKFRGLANGGHVAPRADRIEAELKPIKPLIEQAKEKENYYYSKLREISGVEKVEGNEQVLAKSTIEAKEELEKWKL